MSNFVERLRAFYEDLWEAIAEIEKLRAENERLRTALKKIADGQWYERDGTIVRTREAGIALAALEGK